MVAGTVGFAACAVWILILIVVRFVVTKSNQQEVNIVRNVWSSLSVAVLETLWAVEANILAA